MQKATRKSNTWIYKCVIECKDKKSASSIEWYWKHKQNSNGKWIRTCGLYNRINHMKYIINEHSEKIENHTIYNHE